MKLWSFPNKTKSTLQNLKHDIYYTETPKHYYIRNMVWGVPWNDPKKIALTKSKTCLEMLGDHSGYPTIAYNQKKNVPNVNVLDFVGENFGGFWTYKKYIDIVLLHFFLLFPNCCRKTNIGEWLEGEKRLKSEQDY